MSSSAGPISTSSAVSGASDTTSSPANAAGSSRATSKMTTSGKSLDGARKQAGSPVDAATQRKPTARNAWARDNPNPLTGRSGSTSNGVAGQSRAAPSPKMNPLPAKESGSQEKHANDRFMFMLANFVGLHASITLKNGDRYTGVFSTASFDSPRTQYVLKMVKRLPSVQGQVNGITEVADEYITTGGPDRAMAFETQDVVDFAVATVRFDKPSSRAPNGVSSGFKTDTDISGNVGNRERVLQKWEPSGDTAHGMSLDSDGRGWDQFEANQRLFGLKTDYDENFYTTTIDRSRPDYDKVAAKADKLQREIEAEKALTAHVAEERGLLDDSGLDEEMKYSGVTRRSEFPPLPSGQPNKYIPPAQRPPTGKPTVSGAPVDPAIISSALAQPATVPSKTFAERTAAKPTDGIANKTSDASASPAIVTPQTEAAVPKPKSTAEVNTETVDAAEPNHGSKPLQNAATANLSQPPPVPAANPPSDDGGAAATVEKDVVTAFKNFSAHERMRAVENQRRLARQDKAVKLNDLKKFAQNFKLHTPVPQDLVPILAKDKAKQEAIMKKNQENVAQAKTTPPKQSAAVAPASAEKPVAKPAVGRSEAASASPIAATERQNQQRPRHNQNNFAQGPRAERGFQNQTMPIVPVRHQPGNLGPRLQNNMSQAHFNSRPPMAIPNPPFSDPRVPPSGPSASSSGVTSPTSAARFNVKATEFRPNPAANTFLPSHSPSSSSSPQREPSTRPFEQKPKKGSFFEGRPPLLSAEQRVDIEKAFNPIPRLKREAESDKDHGGYHWNLGIRPAYHSEPRWPVPKENEEKTYDQLFEQPQMPVPSISPQQHGMLNQPPMAHQHQMPMNIPHGGPLPQMPTPHHTPRHAPNQPHHGGPSNTHHFDDHQMRFTQSTSSVHPSPRPMQPFIAYNGQGGQPVPVYQGGVPGYTMSPSGHPMTARQVSGGPHFMASQSPSMGGHMMAQQPSSGPYMNVPINAQVQLYTPVAGAVYPQHNGPMPPQPGPNGYSSPRPPAPMMAHQGSQQGHSQQPMVYMQSAGHGPMFALGPQGPGKYNRYGPGRMPSDGATPVTPMRGAYGQPHTQYSASPHQHPHYPVQPHRGTPSATYAQPMLPTHSMPLQGMPPVVNAVGMIGDNSEDVK